MTDTPLMSVREVLYSLILSKTYTHTLWHICGQWEVQGLFTVLNVNV